MNTPYTYPQKPTLVNVIAWTTLASGIVNLGWGLAFSAMALVTIVGICCVPLTILPSILGIFEIMYAAKLLSSSPQPVRPATNIAVLEIVTILAGNFFSMIVGVLSLIFYNDPAVKEYFARLNEDLPVEPAPVVPPVPMPLTPTVEPIPSPITGEEPVTPVTPVAPDLTTPTSQEIPLPETEPSIPPVPPEAPDSAADTLVSSLREEEPPTFEPNPPEDPDNPERPPQ